MAQIRLKRKTGSPNIATDTLQKGMPGIIGDYLTYGPYATSGDENVGIKVVAAWNANNTFSETNTFMPASTSVKNVQFFNYATTPSLITYVENGMLYTSNPTTDQQVATKNYVDAKVQGLDIKSSVRLASTIALGTLTGLLTVDGVITVAGDRILVKNQATASQNGIYVVSAGAWTRATDANSGVKLISAFVFVETGNTLSDTGWTCTNDSITEWTTAITWTQFSGAGAYTADETSLTRNGTQFSINAPVSVTTANYLIGFSTTNAASQPQLDARLYTSDGKYHSEGTVIHIPSSTLSMSMFGSGNEFLISSGEHASLTIGSYGDLRLSSGYGHVYTYSERLQVRGTSTGGTIFAVTNTSTTNYTATFPNVTGTVNLANTTTTASRILLSTSTAGQAIWSTTTIGSMAYASTNSYQPIDADLTAIATLSGTVGLLRKIAANTWTLDTAPYTTSSGITSVSISGGSTNGYVSLTANGVTTSAFVTGLGSMAYVANTGTTSITTLGTITTGTWNATAIGATKGGTGQTTVTRGDILYGSGTNAWSKLTANATTIAKYLRSISSGTPTWGQIAYSEISGTPSIPTGFSIGASSNILLASGGTNTTSYNVYTARTDGRFYRHADNPNTTTSLKYGGTLYAYSFEGIIDGGVWS